MEVRVKLLQDDAKSPTLAEGSATCYDVYAAMGYNVRAHERAQVRLGISVSVPEGYALCMTDDEDLAFRKGLKVFGGVIDHMQTGEISIGIMNLSDSSYIIERGQKIGRMFLQKIEDLKIASEDVSV